MASPNTGSIQREEEPVVSTVEDQASRQRTATLKAQKSLARIESSQLISWIYSCFCCACSIDKKKRGTWTPMNTNKLEIARREGLKYFAKSTISLLTTDTAQYVWIMSQLFVTVVLFGFAIGGLVRDNRTVYDVARAIVAGVFLLCGVIDTLIKLINHGCTACCTIDVEVKSQPEPNAANDKESDSSNIEDEKDSKVSNTTNKRGSKTQAQKTNTVPEYTVTYQEDTLPKVCCKYLMCVNGILTFIRSILPEVFFYILLLLHILQHSHSRNYEKFDFNNNKFDGSFFLFVLVAYIVMVYMVRIFLWCYVFFSVQKSRKHSPPCCNELESVIQSGCCCFCCEKDGYIYEAFQEFHKTTKVFCYPDCCLTVRVFFHILGQMLVQGIMITSIWVKVEYEQQIANGDPRGFSPYLWCMILGGFFLPLIGNIAFLIPNYYWIEEFLVGLCIDEIKNDLEIANISPSVHYDELKNDYVEMKSRLWYEKFIYPFMSPGLVFLSLVYCILLLSFAVFATLTFDENRFTTYVVMDGSVVWIIFFVIGVILVNIVNIQVVIITAFWCLVVLAILYIICLLLAVVCAIIYFFPCVICVLCYACIATRSQTK